MPGPAGARPASQGRSEERAIVHFGRIERVDYAGPLWEVEGIHPRLKVHLAARDRLVVLAHGSPPYAVVLGVPHHSAVGHGQLCERRLDREGRPNPRVSDEATAPYALVALEALRREGVPARLVVMAHATTHDPNKHARSPYTCALFEEPVALLFECHGSGPRRALPLELSAGNNPLADPLRCGRALAETLERRYALGVQREPGTREALIFHPDGSEMPGRLQLSARRTLSLVEAGRLGIQALHLEAKPRFRTPRGSELGLTPEGRFLGQAIARALVRYLDG